MPSSPTPTASTASSATVRAAVATSPSPSPSPTRSPSSLSLLAPPATAPVPLFSISSYRLPPLLNLLPPLTRARHVPHSPIYLFPHSLHRYSGCSLSLPIAILDSIPLSSSPPGTTHRYPDSPLLHLLPPPPSSRPPPPAPCQGLPCSPLPCLLVPPTSAGAAISASSFSSPSPTRSSSPLPLPLPMPPAAAPVPLSSTSSRRLPPLLHLFLSPARAHHVPHFPIHLFPHTNSRSAGPHKGSDGRPPTHDRWRSHFLRPPSDSRRPKQSR